MKENIPTVLIALTIALFSGRAEGMLIRHTFGGEITQVNGVPQSPWEGAGIGSTWEFSYVFDTGAPDLDGNPAVGFYLIDNGIISVDGVEVFATSGFIEVLDGFIGVDQYTISLSGTPLGGGNVFLTSPSGTLASDAIPIDFALPDWTFGQFQFGSGPAGFDFILQGPVLSFTSSVVPGPGGLAFLILGCNAFVLSRRRRTRG